MLYAVRLVRLPLRVKAMVVRDGEDFYNVYINDQLGPAEQKKALDHELEHLDEGDFDSGEDIRSVENV